MGKYGILADLYPRFASVERCSVPRPVAVTPEADGFLMEYVDGHVLADDLRFVHFASNRSGFRRLQNHFRDCGRWLRYFQQFNRMRCAEQAL